MSSALAALLLLAAPCRDADVAGKSPAVLLKEGREALRAKDPARASDLLRACLQLEQNPDCQLWSGNLESAYGSELRAAWHWQRFITLAPADARAPKVKQQLGRFAGDRQLDAKEPPVDAEEGGTFGDEKYGCFTEAEMGAALAPKLPQLKECAQLVPAGQKAAVKLHFSVPREGGIGGLMVGNTPGRGVAGVGDCVVRAVIMMSFPRPHHDLPANASFTLRLPDATMGEADPTEVRPSLAEVRAGIAPPPPPLAGPLPQAAVIEAFKEQMPGFKLCIDDARARGTPPATLKLSWQVELDGSVSGVEVGAAPPKSEKLVGCVKASVMAMHFPAHTERGQRIVFPMKY